MFVKFIVSAALLVEILNLGTFKKVGFLPFISFNMPHIIIMSNNLILIVLTSVLADVFNLTRTDNTCPWVLSVYFILWYFEWIILAPNIFTLTIKALFNMVHIIWTLFHVTTCFSDEALGAICQDQCELDYVDCNLACSSSSCLIECGRILTDCVKGFEEYLIDPS